MGRGQCPKWGQKDILERILVPLGEGNVEGPVGMKQVAQIMQVLLSQSVLSSFLGAENEDNIVTYKESTDHKLSSLYPEWSQLF